MYRTRDDEEGTTTTPNNNTRRRSRKVMKTLEGGHRICKGEQYKGIRGGENMNEG